MMTPLSFYIECWLRRRRLFHVFPIIE